MASPLYCLLLALLCCSQVAWCADNKTESAVDQILGPIKSAAQSGIAQAQKLVQDLKNLANFTNNAAKGPLQKILGDFAGWIKSKVDSNLQYGKNVTSCVTGQLDHAKNITELAAKNLFGCTQDQVQKAVEILKDMTDLSNQLVQLGRDGVSQTMACFQNLLQLPGCVFGVDQMLVGRGAMIAQGVAGDVGKLAGQGLSLPRDLFQCGTVQVARATSEVGHLISDIGTCIDKVAASS